MICCLLSALFAGNLAAAGRIAGTLVRRPRPLAVAGLVVLIAGAAAVAPAAGAHAGHYVARAEANHRSILDEILAAPLCPGGRST